MIILNAIKCFRNPQTKTKYNIIILLSFILTFVLNPLNCQKRPEYLSMNFSYHGNNIWNPGFNAGLDYVHTIDNGKNRKGKEYTRHRYFNADLGFYVDPGSHTGIFTHFGFNHRKFRDNKLNFNIGISPAGIYRSFLLETYEVSDDGQVSEVTLPGRWYFAPVVTMGMGKFRNNTPGTGWFFEIDLMGLVPYNSYAMLLMNTKLGYRVKIG